MKVSERFEILFDKKIESFIDSFKIDYKLYDKDDNCVVSRKFSLKNDLKGPKNFFVNRANGSKSLIIYVDEYFDVKEKDFYVNPSRRLDVKMTTFQADECKISSKDNLKINKIYLTLLDESGKEASASTACLLK